MNNKKIEDLKKEYQKIPISDELDFIVKKAIKEGKKNNMKSKKMTKIVASLVLATGIFTVSINVSPTFANTLSQVSGLSKIVRVLSIETYLDKESYFASINSPQIEGLENVELQTALNEKYLKENEELYKGFVSEMEDLEQAGGGHVGVYSGYDIKTDNESILSIGRYVVNLVGSSSTVYKYDTIDKSNQVLITLPSLFKDESYIDIISENIKEQMVSKHKEDSDNFYWVEGIEQDVEMGLFDKISSEQNFYINEDNKLVISFDKYDVAPGYMGVVEFIIPTDVIVSNLVSDKYIK